jgi:hypothetical protein
MSYAQPAEAPFKAKKMSYAQPAEVSSKAIYKEVLDNFYSDVVYNPVTKTMTSVSYFPYQDSKMTSAVALGNKNTELLTCASNNPDFVCASSHDCPGISSTCGKCSQKRCVK